MSQATVDVEKSPGGDVAAACRCLVHGLVDKPLPVDVGVVHSLQTSNKIAEVQPGRLAAKSPRAPSPVSAQRRFLPFVVNDKPGYLYIATYPPYIAMPCENVEQNPI